MRHETVTKQTSPGVDWKGIGYLVSIASVFFLGAVAGTKEDAPAWYYPVLILGMVTSIIGMGCRYKAHLDQQREIRKAKSEVRQG
jgi:CDP-diglyceride synthetase